MDEHEEKPKRVGSTFRQRPRLMVGITAGLIYGLLARMAFGLDFNREMLNTLTWGFLTFVPLTIGALTVYFSPRPKRGTGEGAFFLPWITCVIFLAIVSILALEAAICIWMASPFFFLVSGIGGLLMRFVLRALKHKTANYVLTFLMLAPFVTSPLENQLPRPDMFRVVETQIRIAASPEVVWEQIVRVPEIQPHERRLTFFQLLGIPQPLMAEMQFEGAGELRYSIYENGMAFNEEVLVWQPGDTLSFSIKPDPVIALPMPFNEIDGTFFAMVDGTYRIEPLAGSGVILHLSSTHRLSTSFNAYGGLWTDFILRDLQQYILEIIQRRAEAAMLLGGL